jgi:hypothetical protein
VGAEEIGELLTEAQIKAELGRRNKKSHFQTVPRSGNKQKLLEEDGWSVSRPNKNTVRMQKAKPCNEQLEDQAWCLMARMGFSHLSKGRSFKIKGHVRAYRQIDVFAADQDAAVFIECTGREVPAVKSLNSLIEKICSERRAIHTAVRTNFPSKSKLKQRWIIATRNVIWRDVDLNKAKASNIFVLRDNDIDYYRDLTAHLGIAARFQFLAEIFSDEEIPGLTLKVPATRSKRKSSLHKKAISRGWSSKGN